MKTLGPVSLLATLSLATDVVAAEHRGTFLTTLGSDTIAVETYVRSETQLEGDILLRVPSTMRFHYRLTFANDGSVKTSAFEIRPVAGSAAEEQRRLNIAFDKGTMRLTSVANGEQQSATRPADPSPNVWFLGGYASSFGIYGSYGMYEHILTRVPVSATETTELPAFAAATGEASKRLFRRPTSTTAAVDYFRMAWIHLTLNEAGEILSADASGTTERTMTKRVDFMDIGPTEKEFAAAEKAGKGIGAASPNVESKGTVGGASVIVRHGSPRLRGRTGVADALAKAGGVWRTGANEATVLEISRDMVIGGELIPAGKYSLWTLPKPDGVQLIVNKQTGQWGVAYKADQDFKRIPMKVEMLPTPQDNFTIGVIAANGGSVLAIQWDTFRWSVPIAPASK